MPSPCLHQLHLVPAAHLFPGIGLPYATSPLSRGLEPEQAPLCGAAGLAGQAAAIGGHKQKNLPDSHAAPARSVRRAVYPVNLKYSRRPLVSFYPRPAAGPLPLL